MKLEDFDKLQAIADEEILMPDTFEAIMEKNNLLPSIVQKWTKLYQRQKMFYSALNLELLEMYGELYKCYKFPKNTKDLQTKYNMVLNEFWDNAKAVDSQINCVPAYIAKMKEVNQQKYILEFIEKTLDNIKNLSFTIKNYIEYKKILTTNY